MNYRGMFCGSVQSLSPHSAPDRSELPHRQASISRQLSNASQRCSRIKSALSIAPIDLQLCT